MTGAGALYAHCLDSLDELVTGLEPARLRAPVPATPNWNVRTLVAHLAGGASDMVSGRMEGAPSPAWTARHVAERTALPLPHLLDELRTHQPKLERIADEAAVPAMVWDISVHLTDLHEALDLGMAPEPLWQPVLATVAARQLADAPATIHAGSETWGAGGPELEVAPYELYRALFSRRSRRQVSAWGRPLDDDQLAAFSVFGPREDDQPVP